MHFVRWIALIVLLTIPGIAEAKRVALVIGNSRYAAATVLTNPAADARLIAASLKKAGFDSVDLHLDLGKSELEAQLRNFGNRAEGADVALIYYAGHGIEAGGQNYLIPIDAKLERDRDLDVEATRLDTALLMSGGARMRIVVLDACRNNPFVNRMVRSLRSRAVGRGLAAVEPEGETLVVYSAKAGATAADGEGANSPFARALANRLPQPGLEISLLFRAVRDDVLKMTGRTQEPFTYGSLSGTAFYFVGGSAAPQGSAIQAVTTPSVSKETTETLYWQGALTANTEPAFKEYLKRYPQGTFSELAKQNLTRFVAAPASRQKSSLPASDPGLLGSAAGAMPDLGAAFSAPTGQIEPGAGATAASRFAFLPSPELRKRHTANFLAQIRATNAQVATLLEAQFALQDMFAATDKAVAKYGLKSDNLADAMTILIDTLRDAASGESSEPTKTQALAVRNQMALILLATPESANATPAKKQEMADTMILTALLMSFAQESAKASGPASLKQFADSVAETGKKDFGIDFRRIRITDDGYRM
jgi:Caspase domain